MTAILVTQATGGQSLSVIKHLLAGGSQVHALVRDPSKPLPVLLQNPAVTVFKGNSDNENEVYEAAKGAQGVFINTYPAPGLEVVQARAIVAAARKAGIEAAVASTAYFSNERDKWDNQFTRDVGMYDYCASKAAVEEIVQAAGFKYHAFLRPGFLHTNYTVPYSDFNWPGLKQTGVLEHAFEEGVRMPHTSVDDIGRFGAAALLDPARFDGAGINFARDTLTADEAAAVVSRVAGREVRARKRTPEEIEEMRSKSFVQNFHLWNASLDFTPLVEASKEAEVKYGIKYTPFEEALASVREKLIAALP